MIRNPHLLEAFEREQARRNPLTLEQKLRLMNGMWEEARSVGALSKPRPDLRFKIEFARRLNAWKNPRTPIANP